MSTATLILSWVSSLWAHPSDFGLANLHNCVSQFLKIHLFPSHYAALTLPCTHDLYTHLQYILVVLFSRELWYMQSTDIWATKCPPRESFRPKSLWWDNSQWWLMYLGPSLKWRGSHGNWRVQKKKRIWMKDCSTQPPREAEPMSSACVMAVPQLTPDPIQNIKCDPAFWVALYLSWRYIMLPTQGQVHGLIDWLSWLESEPLEPILVLIKLSSNIRNFEMKCDLLTKKDVVATINCQWAILLPKLTRRMFPWVRV